MCCVVISVAGDDLDGSCLGFSLRARPDLPEIEGQLADDKYITVNLHFSVATRALETRCRDRG